MIRPISEPRRISILPEEPDLSMFGYAPGGYTFNCLDCTSQENAEGHLRRSAAKRAWRCEKHARDRLWAWKRATELLAADDPHGAIYKELLNHSKRTTGLIRACSREVIKRREINSHRMQLLGFALKVCKQLRFYAMSHRDKVPKLSDPKLIMDTMNKARVNDNLAFEGEQAIIFEVEPGAMGKP